MFDFFDVAVFSYAGFVYFSRPKWSKSTVETYAGHIYKGQVTPVLALKAKGSKEDVAQLITELSDEGFNITTVLKTAENSASDVQYIIAVGITRHLNLRLSAACIRMMSFVPETMGVSKPGQNIRVAQKASLILPTIDSYSFIESALYLHQTLASEEFSGRRNPRERFCSVSEYFGLRIACLMSWADFSINSFTYGSFTWIISWVGDIVFGDVMFGDIVFGIVFSMWLHCRILFWYHVREKFVQSMHGFKQAHGDKGKADPRLVSKTFFERMILRTMSIGFYVAIFGLQWIVGAVFQTCRHMMAASALFESVYYVISVVLIAYSEKYWIPLRLNLECSSTHHSQLTSSVRQRYFAYIGIFLARFLHLIVSRWPLASIQQVMTVLIISHVVLKDRVLLTVKKFQPQGATVVETSQVKQCNDTPDLHEEEMYFTPLDDIGTSLLRECSLRSFSIDNHSTDISITLTIGALFASVVPTMAPLLAACLWYKQGLVWNELLLGSRRPIVSDDSSMEPWLPLVKNMSILAILLNLSMIYVRYLEDSERFSTVIGIRDLSHTSVAVGLFCVEHTLLMFQLVVTPNVVAAYNGYELKVAAALKHLLARGESLLAFATLEVLQRFDQRAEEARSWVAVSPLSHVHISKGFYDQYVIAKAKPGEKEMSPVSKFLHVITQEVAGTGRYYIDAASAIYNQRWAKLELLELQNRLRSNGSPFQYMVVVMVPFMCSKIFSVPWWATLPQLLLYTSFLHNKTQRLKNGAAMSIIADPFTLASLLKKLPQELPHDSNTDRCEWVNTILKFSWTALAEYACSKMRTTLGPVFEANKPSFLATLDLFKLDLGSVPPTITAIRIFDQPKNSDKVEMEMDFSWDSKLDLAIAAKIVAGAELIVDVSNFRISGTIRIIMQPLIPKIPPFSFAKLTFFTPPKVDFNLNFADTDLMEEGESTNRPGGLTYTITRTVRQVLETVVRYPKWMQIKVDADDETPLELFTTEPPEAVLCVKVLSCADLVVGDFTTSDPYVVLNVLEDSFKTEVVPCTLNPKWEDEDFAFMIHDRVEQKLHVEVWDKDLGSVGTFLGTVDIDISELKSIPQVQTFDLLEVHHGSITLELELLLLHGSKKHLAKHLHHVDVADEMPLDSYFADTELPFDSSSYPEPMKTFLSHTRELCEGGEQPTVSKKKAMSQPSFLGLGGLEMLGGVMSRHEAKKDFHSASIIGVLSISNIVLTNVKSIKNMITGSHAYSAYVTFNLGRQKRKTTVIKTDQESTIKEVFHFVVSAGDDTIAVKLKFIAVNVHLSLATIQVPLSELQVAESKFDQDIHLAAKREGHQATGQISFDCKFQLSERGFLRKASSVWGICEKR